MADDADQSSSATDDAVSGPDNISANKIKSHQGNFSKKDKFYRSKTDYVASSIIYCNTLYSIAAGISISAPLAHQISPLALYQMPPSSSKPGSPKASRKPTPSPSHQLVIDPSSTGNNLVRPVIHLIGRNSAPGSRRGSGNSLYGSGSLIGNILYQT